MREFKCKCGEASTGWTEIKCCNICGKPHKDEKIPWSLGVSSADLLSALELLEEVDTYFGYCTHPVAVKVREFLDNAKSEEPS